MMIRYVFAHIFKCHYYILFHTNDGCLLDIYIFLYIIKFPFSISVTMCDREKANFVIVSATQTTQEGI